MGSKTNSKQMIMCVNKCTLMRVSYPFQNWEWFLKILIHEMGEVLVSWKIINVQGDSFVKIFPKNETEL
jgi:hypothetical protein